MTEIVARLPRSRGALRVLQAVTLLAGLGLVALGAFALRPLPRAHAAQPQARTPRTEHGIVARSPVVRAEAAQVRRMRAARALGRDAALGFERSFFTASPGGVLETAARVAQWRPLVVRAARRSGLGPRVLEGMVLVESSGLAAATNGSRAGLTQLDPAVARHLGLRVNRRKTARLRKQIAHTFRVVHARQLRRWRSRYDQRFAPARELRATVRFLVHARRVLGRDDLAVAAYHVGVGNVRRAAAMAGKVETAPSYAQLYFGSSPGQRAAIWHLLGAAGDSGRDYYWKVVAAEHVMRLYRYGALAYTARLQARKNSAEEVLHPRAHTSRFRTPDAIARAWRHHVLRAIPRDVARTHIAISRALGQEAGALGRSRRLYRGLRPAALDVLLYIGRHVHELSGGRRLLLTSAVRDNRYQRVLMRVNANAARTYSMHTTGYAFDIARSYSSRRQAAAFQFVLDRLTAANAIAYIREAAAIHIAVATDAAAKLAQLATVG
jgi:soluble lytic murein transglycosylase-like protein